MKRAENQSKAAIVVIGSGEAFDADLGNTAYLFRGKKLPTVLFDCGYQIPERLWKKELHVEIDAICFTHLHADHSFGIVPLLVRYWEEGRTAPLQIIGPRGTERFVSRLLDMGYPGLSKRIAFPIRFLVLSPERVLALGDLRLSCASTVHSILNYTVRVEVEGKGPSFAVSGDGQITQATKSLVNDVDVLFQEVYNDKPEIPVHADFATVSAWIKKSKVKTIVTSHFARSHKKALIRKVGAQNASKTKWVVSKPGLEIKI